MSDVRAMEMIGASLAVASVLTVIIFGSVAYASTRLVGIVLVPGSKHPILPRVLALVVAWLVSLPACVTVIERTSLKEMVWGHAGELLVAPFLFWSAVLSVAFLWRITKALDTAEKSSSSEGAGGGAQ